MKKKWFVIALFVSLAGCRQSLGERCQVADDCASGVCATSAPKICVPEGKTNGDIDSDLPIDAAVDAAAVAPAQPGP